MSKLILLPNHLGQGLELKALFPQCIDEAVASIDGLIAESPQGGRSFLNKFRTKKPPYDIPLAVLNEHTKDDEIDFILKPVKDGATWGLIVDAGLPCLADPGAKIVFRARQLGIPVETLPGPSSIIMAIQLSGLPSQRFSFHGYVAKESVKRDADILRMHRLSKEGRSLEVFIEAPYRNKHTLESLLNKLPDSAYLCVAVDLCMPTQKVLCHKVETFKKMPLPNIEKKPTIFMIYASELNA
jgi:16S rRNA (cytidine1402-2'-O)-methyltransferase